MSGGSSRALDRNREISSRVSVGSTAVMPKAKHTAELAEEPRPWHRMLRLRAKRTMSSTVRKKASYFSSAIRASSSSICATTLGGVPCGQRSRMPASVSSPSQLEGVCPSGTSSFG